MSNTNTDFLQDILKPYQPQLAINELIVEVNKLFHEFEAKDYDERHPEIHQQLPPIWEEIIGKVRNIAEESVWHILDFGCGTGFESEQIVRNIPQEKIAKLICYDPSPEMLAYCRKRIAPIFPMAIFTSDLNSISSDESHYNLLVTNSLLHHLPDPLNTINRLLPMLSPDAIWIAGHEPSSRFYKNAECLKIYNDFQQESKWRKFLSLKTYLSKLKKLVGLTTNPVQTNPLKDTAEEAFHRGLFKKQPPILIIDRIVDFHVAHSFEEADSGRGFDFEIMQQYLIDQWQIIWVKTYSFMGSYYEGELSPKWSRLCSKISQKFPKDGANFSTVWKRIG